MADYYSFCDGDCFNINRLCICADDRMAVRNKVVRVYETKCCHIIASGGTRCKNEAVMELAARSDKNIWFCVQLCQDHYEMYLKTGVCSETKD